MKFISCTKNKAFPFLLVDNFYTSTEQDLIWKELESFQHLFKVDAKTNGQGVATKDDKPLANLKRIYLEELYPFPDDRQHSNILTAYRKIISKEVIENYKKTTPAGKQFEITGSDCTLINYYDDSNSYGEHFDSFMHTVFVWFYKEPKRFKGGNLIFSESNETVECIHNRMLMFPSYYLHEVTEIQMEEEYKNKGLGKYCITHFYSK